MPKPDMVVEHGNQTMSGAATCTGHVLDTSKAGGSA